MRVIQLEQQHIREIMTSRFVGLEGLMQSQSSKLDSFIGKVDMLIAEGQKAGAELTASPLGRQVDHRLAEVEHWVDESRTWHAKLTGMTMVVRAAVGTSVISFLAAGAAIGAALGWWG